MDGRAQRLVIVADDDESIRLLCRVNLELEGYRVLEATGLEEISRIAAEDEVSLVVLDIHLGREDGIEVARALRRDHPEIPIAFLSGSVDFSAAEGAVATEREDEPGQQPETRSSQRRRPCRASFRRSARPVKPTKPLTRERRFA